MFELTKIAPNTYATADGQFRVELLPSGTWMSYRVLRGVRHELFEADTEAECIGLLRDYIA